jgi:hypothetical protein
MMPSRYRLLNLGHRLSVTGIDGCPMEKLLKILRKKTAEKKIMIG